MTDGARIARSSLRRAALWAALLAALVAVALAAWWTRRAPEAEPPPVLAELDADFTLTDRTGREVGPEDLAGAPWVADLIFTRCVLACPMMTTKMANLDAELPRGGADGGGPAVRLVSITVDPDHDTPEALAEYAGRFDASDRWLFLTGGRDDLVALAAEGLRLGFDPNPPLVPLAPGDDVYHSTRFVLVDADNRVRGYYDTEDPAALDQLRTDLDALLAES